MKIVQFQVVESAELESSDGGFLFALCDDGTLLQYTPDERYDWVEIPRPNWKNVKFDPPRLRTTDEPAP